MADTYAHINIRRDTSANWAAEDPVLKLGEIAADMDKHGLKVGDGTKKWSELPFCTAEVINDLITGGTDKALSAEQGKVLKGLVDEKASTTDLTTLETSLTQIINNNTVDVIDSLTSTEQKKALSANQGKVLKGLIDGKASTTDLTTLEKNITQIINNNTVDVVDNLTSTEQKKALSANQGKVLKDLVDAKADKTTVNNLETSLTKIINGSTVEVIKKRRNTPSLSYGDISRNKVSA